VTGTADVAIAGAGPAGAAAACHFARAGYRVTVIDQQRFPRDKVCGDFVGPWALEEIDRLGLSSQPPFRTANEIRRAALHLNGNQLVGAPLPDAPGLRDHGLCIPRMQMDDAIVTGAVASGAHLLHARVTGYDADANGVTVHYQRDGSAGSMRARLLLGADGSTSLVARTLRGRPSPRRDRIVAVRAYFTGVNGAPDEASLYVNSRIFPGYYWLFPIGETTANVGVGMLLETWPPTQEQLRECLLDAIGSDSAMHARLRGAMREGKIAGWPLATFNPRLPMVADRVALLGDAAGLINPINGEGIQYALQSARWSFETLSHPLSCDALSGRALAPYTARVLSEMRLDMAVSRLLVDLSRNRVLNRVWLSALQTIGTRAALDPDYAEIFGGVLSGIGRARHMLTPSFFWRTVQQAVTIGGRPAVAGALDACVAAAKYSARHPGAMFDWAAQCAIGLYEVATHVGRRGARAS
jgi:geranylgeranyl reductase family protein